MELQSVLLIIFTVVVSNVESNLIADGLTGQIVKWSVGSYAGKSNQSLDFQLEIFSPTTPGHYQVILFLTGFDGIAPTFIYFDFLLSLAYKKQDCIIIALDKLRPIKLPDKEENRFESALNWTIANLNDLFDSDKTPAIIKGNVFPDSTTNGFTLMSHSSAAHPIVLYLNKTCGLIKKLVLLNPVDGFDPFGIVKIYVTQPPKQLPFTIPTLVVAAGLDAVPVLPGFVACAPTNMSNLRFYDSLPGPTWFLNFTHYGHADLLDYWVRILASEYICSMCNSRDPNYPCEFNLYLQNLIKAIIFFIDGVDNKNSAFINAIIDPKKSGLFDSVIDIQSRSKTNGFDVLQTGPFCNHL